MAAVNTASTLTSYLKEVYPDDISVVVPRKTTTLQYFKYDQQLQMGEKAKIPLQVTDEHGFAAKDGAGSLTLATPVAHEAVHYEVGPYQLALRVRISYDLAAQASSSKKAFKVWNEKRFIPIIESAQKRLNVVATYGRDSIGEVDSINSNDIVLKEAAWAPHIWLGAKGAEIDVFSAKTGGSQRNSTTLVITAINSSTRTITVSGTHSSIQQGDFIFYRNFRGQEAYGLFGLARGSSGTIYTVNHGTYEVLQANAYDCGTSQLSLGKILEAASASHDKGCDERLVCMVPGKAFAHLVSNESALRQYGGELRAKNGFKTLDFSLGDIDMEVVPNGVIKRGEFILAPERYTSRIGSTDWTMTLPGQSNEELVLHVADSTDYEMRIYTAQTMVCERMSWITYGTRSDGGVL